MRADKFFAEKFGSRTKAANALRQGLVHRNGKALSPDDEVSECDCFTFYIRKEEFVSNGGYKLARGLDVFGADVSGKTFADLGASTGGFTDCLLQRGAKRVFCVDVGESQLAPSVSADSRVTVMDRTNARYLSKEDFPCPLDGVVSDLSFISLRLVLPAIGRILPENGEAYALFKPQFECGAKGLGKSGICSPAAHEHLLSDFYDFCLGAGISPVALARAPVRERKNIEYILRLVKGKTRSDKASFLRPFQEGFE